MSLVDLGFTAEQETVYRALLAAPGANLASLAEQTLLDEKALRAALNRLEGAGVLRIASDGFNVLDPAIGLGRLIEDIEDELMARYRRVSSLRVEVGVLQTAFARIPAAPDEPEIERIEGITAVRERIAELSFFAHDYICAIQPGGPQSHDSLKASRPLDMRAVRRRLRMRLIHEERVLEDEMNRSYLRELVMHKVGVRLVGQPPGRMLIFDGVVAVVPIDPDDSKRGALVVRHPALITGLQDLFDRVWETAQELPADNIDEPADSAEDKLITDQDRLVLTLLASGATDETAARELGMSVRHLRRRISRLMLVLNARSRFEAGAEAVRRGWL